MKKHGVSWAEDTNVVQLEKSKNNLIREWLRLKEKPTCRSVNTLNRSNTKPYLVEEAKTTVRECEDDDIVRIEDGCDENTMKVRSLMRRIADRMMSKVGPSDGNAINLSKLHFSERLHKKVYPMGCGGDKLKKLTGVDCCSVIDPHGKFYFKWLFSVSLCYIYNLIVIPLRASFPYQTEYNTPIWLTLDVICDIVYLIDVIMIKPRVSFICEGSWIRDLLIIRKRYRKTFLFKMDVISLLPLEILYLYFGTSAVLLRLPRLCKAQTFSQFYTSVDKILSSPIIVRVARTLIYTFYLIHLNACSYYKMSSLEGIGSNGWTYNGMGNAYVRCFYFATKTSTSIGKNPKPENDLEYIYMTFAWLMGVCVFALLVGQIRYIIITATKRQTEYRKFLAETLKCMRELNISSDLQRRITSWFEFTWKQHGTLDDSQALDALPINLKTELAINMHIETLSKVKLFTDCDEALLRDLVLKLRSVIYLPEDIICHKGDVGREMYILKRGIVDVMGGSNSDEVIATLTEGSVFGEISLLNINGINRRTADVKSRSFSNIFVLNKTDFNSVLVYYPEAQQLLLKRANDLMDINAARDRANQESEESKTPIKQPDVEKTEIKECIEENGKEQIVEVEIYKENVISPKKIFDECFDYDIKLYYEKLQWRAMPKNFGRGKRPNLNRQINRQYIKKDNETFHFKMD